MFGPVKMFISQPNVRLVEGSINGNGPTSEVSCPECIGCSSTFRPIHSFDLVSSLFLVFNLHHARLSLSIPMDPPTWRYGIPKSHQCLTGRALLEAQAANGLCEILSSSKSGSREHTDCNGFLCRARALAFPHSCGHSALSGPGRALSWGSDNVNRTTMVSFRLLDFSLVQSRRRSSRL